MIDETKLVARARVGDEDAFTALYRAHAGVVRAVGRRILRTDDVDDFCQETFLLAFTGIKCFDGRSGFRTWLTRIAINQCLTMLRERRRRKRGEGRLVALELNHEGDGGLPALADAALENVAARLDAEKMLQRLSPLQRRIVEMAYLEEWPDAEIAAALGISLPSLSSTLYRVRKKFANGSKISPADGVE